MATVTKYKNINRPKQIYFKPELAQNLIEMSQGAL